MTALVGSLFPLVPADAATSRTVQRVDLALKIAEDQQGDPNVWGAEGPNAFDCSGLVCFYGRGGVYHVGVYVGQRTGRRMIVHAPHPGSSVRLEPIWTGSWFPARLR
ncbi:MAG TPA: hypothetical protein VK204_11750 [Nocardioidaceae bacterium]|nr:hypothetical protein [Nocardioidaceae bacterium]